MKKITEAKEFFARQAAAKLAKKMAWKIESKIQDGKIEEAERITEMMVKILEVLKTK